MYIVFETACFTISTVANMQCHMPYVLSICQTSLPLMLLPKMHHVFANILHNMLKPDNVAMFILDSDVNIFPLSPHKVILQINAHHCENHVSANEILGPHGLLLRSAFRDSAEDTTTNIILS